MSFVLSFENGIKEGSLTSFEMTRIVIPNECEESFPSIFILCGRVQLMNHFVGKTHPYLLRRVVVLPKIEPSTPRMISLPT